MRYLRFKTAKDKASDKLTDGLLSEVHPFPDAIGYFGAPWQPFWIFEVLIEGMIESKTYLAKVDRWVQ